MSTYDCMTTVCGFMEGLSSQNRARSELGNVKVIAASVVKVY